ncbi:hypothetical protein Clacol_001655 [Clathrus columnatus]|uniref:Uncharacterized protein n=1 Tax=Clathrus columnatus TaxID=1419009 RepID=A0AAV5A475_9AGAM|nr:hypothetical protein Clacol_001655 [Clathrus columnatus]
MSRAPSNYRPLRARFPTDPSSSAVDTITSIPRPIPLSPPETELLQDHFARSHEDSISPPEVSQLPHEIPVSKIRRLGMPNVAYTNGGLTTKDPRSYQRQSKWLIIVCPPKSLNREPPILGHTLSSAPAGRFSSGILIPLFPTLYGQLTAIAREFNMPSTTGLCVYLQLQENSNPTFNPRISDETWQILWASYFSDDRPPSQISSHGLPVCGRIEFDIDLKRAKWYNTWMGFTARDSEGISREASIVPSHWRGESRTSFFHPEMNLNTDDNSSPPQDTPFNPVRRQGPRPLILENRESLHRRSSSRNSIQNIFHDLADHENNLPALSSSAAPQVFVPNALSPMVQELEETQSSKNEELNNIVKKWRESSIIASSAPPDKEVLIQPSLDPTPPPSGLDVELKLDLNDYSWSISSAGPLPSPASPGWPEKLPSIHLADRMQVSRCNTPTTCTSNGPASEYGDIPDSQSYCLPSPDIGWRVLDFVPLTPSTCTTSRPEDLLSPVFSRPLSRISSVDIGVRATGSVPTTPLTCTTWGPDVEAELSPSLSDHSFENLSVDVAMRRKGSAPLTPSIVTSWGPADTPVLTLDSPTHLPLLDLDEFDNFEDEIIRDSCWPHIWPYTQSLVLNLQVPWLHVWPYVQYTVPNSGPTSSQFSDIVKLSLEQYPDLKGLYSLEIKESTLLDNKLVLHNRAPSYPVLQIYSPVYPHNLLELYPDIYDTASATEKIIPDTQLVPSLPYPFLQIYPSIYPLNLMDLYPEIPHQIFDKAQAVTLDHVTSNLRRTLPKVIDSSGYPFFDIYPSIQSSVGNNEGIQALFSNGEHPTHEALYPQFDIYPFVYPFCLEEIYPGMDMNLDSFSESEAIAFSCTEYPLFSLYPTVYPFNLMDIYPVKSQNSLMIDLTKAFHSSILTPEYPELKSHVDVCLSDYLRSRYPSFNIYPAIYPFHLADIYPPTATNDSNFEDEGEVSPKQRPNMAYAIVNQTYSQYPSFNIYPAVYPFHLDDIYPPKVTNISSSFEDVGGVLSTQPPNVTYAFVYPYSLVDIYPQKSASEGENVGSPTGCCNVLLELQYPHLDIYPPVYPYSLMDLYPPITDTALSEYPPIEMSKMSCEDVKSSSCVTPSHTKRLELQLLSGESGNSPLVCPSALTYPFLEIYPRVYPYSVDFIYPSLHVESQISVKDRAPLPLPAPYPNFDIYSPVYPFNLEQIYSPVLLLEESWQPRSGAPHQVTTTHIVDYGTLTPSTLDKPVLKDDELGSQSHQEPHIRDSIALSEDENITISENYVTYPTHAIYPTQYPFFTIYPSISPTIGTDSQPLVQLVEYQNEVSVCCYPFIDIYPSVYPHIAPYPQLQPEYPSSISSDPPAGVTSVRLSNHGIGLRPAREVSGHSTPPPIPVKPQALKRSISLFKPNSSTALKPVKQRRSHRELYIAVFDQVQRALAGGTVTEVAGCESEETQNRGTVQKPNPPSLLPKPAVASHYVSSPISDIERRISKNHIDSHKNHSTPPSGFSSSPNHIRRTQITATFNGHVSASIHNRVQSMHLQSLSKPKEEESDINGLNRSKSLSDKRSSILDKAQKFSTAGIVSREFYNTINAHNLLDKKVPPSVPSKPLSKFGRPKPS